MAINPNQPDEFFPYLAKYVSAGGWRCASVAPKSDGTLSFSLKKGNLEIIADWSVGSRREGGIPYRDGSVTTSGGGLRSRTDAAQQLLTRLNELFSRQTPLLLEKRNRETEQIGFGPDTIHSLCRELLVPGGTRIGPYTFSGVTPEGRGLRLAFESADNNIEFMLARASGHDKRKVIARPGPFVLLGPFGTKNPADARRIADYLAYVLSISTHEKMRITDSVPAADSPRSPLSLSQARPNSNPFFFDQSLDEINLFNALFACEGRLAVVSHFDRECTHYFNYLNGPIESYNISPWKIRPSIQYMRNYRTTDTDEIAAIITGCEELFAEKVRETAARERPQLLFTIDSCVAKIIGDDIGAVLKEVAPELGGVPVVRMEVTLGPPENFRRLWMRLVEIFQKPDGPVHPASVNLIGYGHARTRGLSELRALLAAAGVRVNTCLMPSFNLDELPHFGRAALNVLFPSEQVRKSFSYAAPLCSAQILDPPPPFGFGGTVNWLNSILEKLNLPSVGEAWLAKNNPLREAARGALEKEAEGLRAAVVLMENHFEAEAAPLERFGVPWLQCLDEMGFGLDVLVLKTPGADVADKRHKGFADLKKSLAHSKKHKIVHLKSAEESAAALEKSGSGIVYTEIYQDRRVTAAGKTPFSATDFEMGFDGFLRSQERLIGYCRNRFFSRYKKYLRKETEQL